MKSVANIFGLLIVGLVIVALAKKPQIISTFFNGTQGNLALLTK